MAQTKTLGSMNPRPVGSMNSRPGGITSGNSQPFQRPGAAPLQRAMPGSAPAGQPRQQSQQQPQQNKSSMPKPDSGQMLQNDKYNSVGDFVTLMRGFVNGFALLNDEVITQNLKLANGEGMSVDDRTISFECADYVMSNLAFILMGLVLDVKFKQSFIDAVVLEIRYDKLSDQEKKELRASMDNKKSYESNGSIVLGVTAFMPGVGNAIMERCYSGFHALDKYAGEFDAEVDKMSNDQKAEYGFIFSNFMYLIRAFTHNNLFMSYVVTVIEKVKKLTTNS